MIVNQSSLISIIVPCYNQAHYLEECLQSVLEQTYPNWECIIVNDGSPDNTEEIAKKWLEKDPRFRYLKKENGGLSSARNAGIEVAKGEWLQFLDSDDTLEKEKLETSIANNENAQVIISQFFVLKNNQKLPGYCLFNPSMFSFDKLLLHWGKEISIPIHCGVFSIELFKNFKFDTSLKSMEDWLMWLHIFHQNPTTKLIDSPLVNYRKEDDKSMSGDLKKLVQQRLEIFPKIKILYGENIHDKLVYHLYQENSIDLLNNKTELQKISSEFFISKYWKLKALLYKKLHQ
jgi:hypothetical protein